MKLCTLCYNGKQHNKHTVNTEIINNNISAKIPWRTFLPQKLQYVDVRKWMMTNLCTLPAGAGGLHHNTITMSACQSPVIALAAYVTTQSQCLLVNHQLSHWRPTSRHNHNVCLSITSYWSFLFPGCPSALLHVDIQPDVELYKYYTLCSKLSLPIFQ